MVTKEELELKKEEIELENADLKADARRRMAWTAILSMVMFPLLVFVAPDTIITILGEMSPMFFMSMAGIVAAFFGVDAWISKK